jgi:hypothetical protein
MVNHLQGICCHNRFNGPNCKRKATLNFGIIISVWLLCGNVLSVITSIPKHFMLVMLDFMLLLQATLMGICELFLVKNCMILVFSKVSENKFALNQLLISVNVPLMYFIKLCSRIWDSDD